MLLGGWVVFGVLGGVEEGVAIESEIALSGGVWRGLEGMRRGKSRTELGRLFFIVLTKPPIKTPSILYSKTPFAFPFPSDNDEGKAKANPRASQRVKSQGFETRRL